MQLDSNYQQLIAIRLLVWVAEARWELLSREMAKLPDKKRLEFVATSLQIKKEAENSGLKIVDETAFHTSMLFSMVPIRLILNFG